MKISTIKAVSFVIALSVAVGLSKEAEAQAGPNQTTGAIIGGILGGVIGGSIGGSTTSRILGGVAGVAIGSVIGASIGSALDEQDRRQLAAMTRATATSGKNRRYRNSKTGVTLTTRTAGIVGDCRTVEQEVVMADGTRRVDSVQACRTQKGWKFGA
jgi:predicted lipid-binding transport protein (Tim44 family)